MGLLDQLAGTALGALNAGNDDANGGMPGAAHPGMADVIAGLLGGQSAGGGSGMGGLGGLLATAQQSGLGEIVASWIGKGQNLPISASQLSGLLGSDQIAAIAQKLGLPPELATQALAHLLPQAVDHVTPDGQVPSDDLLSQGLAMFRTLSAGR